MEDQGKMPQAGPEHARLQAGCGTWKVKTLYFFSPTGTPLEGEATEKIEAFGTFFTRSHFKSNLMGMPFEGSATVGYELHSQRYVSTWIDSLMPALFHFTGTWDEGTQTMSMSGDGPSLMGTGSAKYRTVEKVLDDNHRELDMFVTGPDGSEMQMFHYEYERA